MLLVLLNRGIRLCCWPANPDFTLLLLLLDFVLVVDVAALVATGRASGTIPERVLLLAAGRASPVVTADAAGFFVVVDDDDDAAAPVIVRLGCRLLLLLTEATACGILERERVGILVTAISLFKKKKKNWN